MTVLHLLKCISKTPEQKGAESKYDYDDDHARQDALRKLADPDEESEDKCAGEEDGEQYDQEDPERLRDSLVGAGVQRACEQDLQ